MTINPTPISDAIAALRRRLADPVLSALEQLSLQELAAFDAQTYFGQQGALGDYLHLAITKFTLSSGTTSASTLSTDKARQEATGELVLRCQQLTSHMLMLPLAVGQSLFKSHLDTAVEILLAIQALINDVEARHSCVPQVANTQSNVNGSRRNNGSDAILSDLMIGKCLLDTGIAWKCAETLKTLPRTNTQAVLRSWNAKLDIVRDVINETKELIASSPAASAVSTGFGQTGNNVEMEMATANDTRNHGHNMDSGNNSDDDCETEKLSSDELELAQSALKIAQLLVLLMKRSSEVLRSTPETVHTVSMLDRLPGVALLLQESLDVIGSSLYPPQDRVAIEQSANNLSDYVKDIQHVVTALLNTSESTQQSSWTLWSSQWATLWHSVMSKLHTALGI